MFDACIFTEIFQIAEYDIACSIQLFIQFSEIFIT